MNNSQHLVLLLSMSLLTIGCCPAKPPPAATPNYQQFSCEAFKDVLPIQGTTQSEVNRAALKATLFYNSLCQDKKR